jgi:hypothetical protein
MHQLRIRLVTVLALLSLGVMSASPIAAQGNGGGRGGNPNPPGLGNGNGPGSGGGNSDVGLSNNPNLAATPELGSLALFGSGIAGAAGYAFMRIRAGRRQDHEEPR